jgi:membrane associated rhomboid family serine protease
MEGEVPPAQREPLINAPLVVAATSGLLVALHAWWAAASPDEQLQQTLSFALDPRRLHEAVGSQWGYSTILEASLTLLSTALLHANWMHVLVNAGMLLALGAPVARYLGGGVTGAGKWMLVFVGAVMAGSAAYVLLTGPEGAPAVGSSGGVSGMFAAAFLLHPYGGLRPPWDRSFLTMTGAFAAMNLILVMVGPLLAGAGVAWQAHAGGYVGGLVMMLLVGRRPGR